MLLYTSFKSLISIYILFHSLSHCLLVFAVILSIGTVMVVATTASATIVVKSDQAISAAKHVDCERQCPYYYFPICATNGNPAENRMFVNICEMHALNCDVEKKEKSKQMQSGRIINLKSITHNTVKLKNWKNFCPNFE